MHENRAKMRENLTSQQTIISSDPHIYEMKLFSVSHLPWCNVINLDYMSIIQIPFSVVSPLNTNVNLKLSYVQNFPSELFQPHAGLFHTCQTSLSKVICFTTSLEMKWDVWFCLIKFHALLPPSSGLSANWSSFQLNSSVFVLILCWGFYSIRWFHEIWAVQTPICLFIYLTWNCFALRKHCSLFLSDFIPFLTIKLLFELALSTMFRIFKILIYLFKTYLFISLLHM